MLKKDLSTPLGPVTVMTDGRAITGLWFTDQQQYGSTLPRLTLVGDSPLFKETQTWLNQYFAGDQPAMTLPVRPEGTTFRQTVWQVLQSIPYGQVRTYGEVAQVVSDQVGHDVGARSIGGAVGNNPISLLIPCHRVVAGTGDLTGYAGGLDRKRSLLELEGQLKSGQVRVERVTD